MSKITVVGCLFLAIFVGVQLNCGESGIPIVPVEVIFLTTLYFCHFVWLEGDHYFDIYVQKRDRYCSSNTCIWEIFATGPCRTNKDPPQCYRWNTPSSVQQSNNTLLV
ncbi:hypothetical protein V8G54_011207 [Vigna mungo]|uniref:Secreted protein n=1 Tax=Vigna mungo TaxID=3915 RepID=A0AAQ3NRJ6_VIGMU